MLPCYLGYLLVLGKGTRCFFAVENRWSDLAYQHPPLTINTSKSRDSPDRH